MCVCATSFCVGILFVISAFTLKTCDQHNTVLPIACKKFTASTNSVFTYLISYSTKFDIVNGLTRLTLLFDLKIRILFVAILPHHFHHVKV